MSASEASAQDVYATPRVVTDLSECTFYHTMEVPEYGLVHGEWDLRGGERAYLGEVDLRGKRVLEIGTASGFLCYYMERQGAEVVAHDLSPDDDHDLIPYTGVESSEFRQALKTHVARVNNAFWLSHRAHGSRARVVYGTVYDIPRNIGTFDVATFGSVLLHLRDPFLALHSALGRTKETVIITDRAFPWIVRAPLQVSGVLGRAVFFRPDAATGTPEATWWRLTPQVLRSMIAVLGFEDTVISYHRETYEGRKRALFTLVGRRTRPMPSE